MLKSLFLNPPSFNGFDGAAGSRYQCTREVKSFWYPTWLAQLAALVEGSRLIDAPARGNCHLVRSCHWQLNMNFWCCIPAHRPLQMT